MRQDGSRGSSCGVGSVGSFGCVNPRWERENGVVYERSRHCFLPVATRNMPTTPRDIPRATVAPVGYFFAWRSHQQILLRKIGAEYFRAQPMIAKELGMRFKCVLPKTGRKS